MPAPAIPRQKCFRCGNLTNQTQSVLGVMHTECFRIIHTGTAFDVISRVLQGLAEVRNGQQTIGEFEASFKTKMPVSQSA